MPHIIFVDDEGLDWSNFSVAGNLRKLYGGFDTPVEMYDKCDLSTLKSDDYLFLSGHGDSNQCGKFANSDDLAKTLADHKLSKEHRHIVLVSCSSAVGQQSFASKLQLSMKKLKYANIDVMGGTGPVVVGPSGREAVDKNRVAEASKIQGDLETKHSVTGHCDNLVTDAKKDPTPKKLAAAADQIAVTLSGFYADFMSGLKPMLKSDKEAYKILR